MWPYWFFWPKTRFHMFFEFPFFFGITRVWNTIKIHFVAQSASNRDSSIRRIKTFKPKLIAAHYL